MVRRFISLIFLVPLVVLLGSHLGALHPLGDSLAMFCVPLAGVGVLSVAILAWLRLWPLVAVGGTLVLF